MCSAARVIRHPKPFSEAVFAEATLGFCRLCPRFRSSAPALGVYGSEIKLVFHMCVLVYAVSDGFRLLSRRLGCLRRHRNKYPVLVSFPTSTFPVEMREGASRAPPTPLAISTYQGSAKPVLSRFSRHAAPSPRHPFLTTNCNTTITTATATASATAKNRQGGANGSIRFEPEINHGANAGLTTALQLLKPIKKKFDEVGWADLMQMASATAVEIAGERRSKQASTRETQGHAF